MEPVLKRIDLVRLLDKKSKDCDPESRSICMIFDCALHPFCTRKAVNKGMIRDYCNQCMNYMTSEIRLCPSVDCPFYPYRMGRSAK
jgi:hypothetical protein